MDDPHIPHIGELKIMLTFLAGIFSFVMREITMANREIAMPEVIKLSVKTSFTSNFETFRSSIVNGLILF